MSIASPPHPHVDDDDPEELPCYRHPNRMTALQCVECERPICTDCAVAAAVGFKCPDDARISRAARGVVPPAKMAIGASAGLAVAVVLGGALTIFGIGFFVLLIGYGIGMLVGIVTRTASGGYRDPTLANIAAVSAALGIVLLPVIDVLTGHHVGLGFVFKLLAGVAAAIAARMRALE
jgi:hypothetical protein